MIWATECNICREALDNGGQYVVNENCRCKVYICTDCFDRLCNCPFCRKQYSSTHCSLVRMNERERQKRDNASGDSGEGDYYFYHDNNDDRFLDYDPTLVVTGLGPTISRPAQRLSNAAVNRAKANWNYWFHEKNGPSIIRSYRSDYHPDQTHHLLNTGLFKDIDQAGVCENRYLAERYVVRQLVKFERLEISRMKERTEKAKTFSANPAPPRRRFRGWHQQGGKC